MDESRRYVDWVHGGNLHGVWGAIVMVIWAGVATGFGFPGVPSGIWVMPVAGLIGFGAGKLVGILLLSSSGRLAQTIYAPVAAGSYAQTNSHIDALEAKGDYKGAVAAWEAVAVSQPRNPWPLIRAGELYARILNEPAMALDRFRQARDVPGIMPEHHRYASQKIVDLYLGPLGDEGRALVELRRLIDAHPGTREAEGAKLALTRLKESRGRTDS